MNGKNALRGTTAIHRRVEACRDGRDGTLIARLASGWAVFGERQFCVAMRCCCPIPWYRI